MAIKLKKICERLHIESREVVTIASQLGKKIADDPNTRLCDDDVRSILKMKFPDNFEDKIEILYTPSNTSQVSLSNEDVKEIICQRVRKELIVLGVSEDIMLFKMTEKAFTCIKALAVNESDVRAATQDLWEIPTQTIGNNPAEIVCMLDGILKKFPKEIEAYRIYFQNKGSDRDVLSLLK